MNLLEVKQKLLNRKEFNTTDTRTRNRILNKIEEVKNNTELQHPMRTPTFHHTNPPAEPKAPSPPACFRQNG